MYTGLMHTHRALGWILIVATTVSLLLSLLAAVSGASPKVQKIATVLARFVETSLFGLLGVTGIAMWIVASWPIGTWWLWAGLGGIVLAGLVSARGTKPAIAGLATSDDGAMRWFAWSLLHWLIALASFGIMYAM